jgi:hypothetical protein
MTYAETTTLSPDAYTNVPFTFHHGDYEARNIMVLEERLEVSGVLDFEFSGSFPIDNDWFDGMGFLGARTAEWRIFDEEPELDDDTPDPDIIEPIRRYSLREIEALNPEFLPKRIPAHMERALLYYFSCNICPWYLREVKEPSKEQLKSREIAIQRVENVLEKYGF